MNLRVVHWDDKHYWQTLDSTNQMKERQDPNKQNQKWKGKHYKKTPKKFRMVQGNTLKTALFWIGKPRRPRQNSGFIQAPKAKQRID